jgi:hypothetical protein
MPNPVKYSTSSESLALKKGNFWVGTGDVSKGPTSTTGFWNGITPPAGGYTVYLNKATQGPSIYTCSNDTDLIVLTNKIAGASFSTAAQALAWYNTQSDKMVMNIDYPPIVTNGLTVNLDVTNVLSYPNSGNDWYDLSGNSNNGGLGIGSPSFSTFDGKRSIRFSNLNKYVYSPPYDGFVLSTNPGISASGTSFTFEAWFYQVSSGSQTVILSNAGGCDGYRWGPQGGSAYWLLGNSDCSQYAEGGVSNATTMVGRWVQMVGIFDRAGTLGNGSRFYHYVNGTLEGSVGTFTPTIQLGTPGITACCGAFDGYLSVVRVYNRALLQSEITANWNAQKSYFGL